LTGKLTFPTGKPEFFTCQKTFLTGKYHHLTRQTDYFAAKQQNGTYSASAAPLRGAAGYRLFARYGFYANAPFNKHLYNGFQNARSGGRNPPANQPAYKEVRDGARLYSKQ
jgi:hypothetical protein